MKAWNNLLNDRFGYLNDIQGLWKELIAALPEPGFRIHLAAAQPGGYEPVYSAYSDYLSTRYRFVDDFLSSPGKPNTR